MIGVDEQARVGAGRRRGIEEGADFAPHFLLVQAADGLVREAEGVFACALGKHLVVAVDAGEFLVFAQGIETLGAHGRGFAVVLDGQRAERILERGQRIQSLHAPGQGVDRMRQHSRDRHAALARRLIVHEVEKFDAGHDGLGMHAGRAQIAQLSQRGGDAGAGDGQVVGVATLSQRGRIRVEADLGARVAEDKLGGAAVQRLGHLDLVLVARQSRLDLVQAGPVDHPVQAVGIDDDHQRGG